MHVSAVVDMADRTAIAATENGIAGPKPAMFS
jgi:hypothetical protein